MVSLRSCLIGCWMGISPAGATPASFMSYGIAQRISKRGKNFGNGEIEGVVAPETAAHAAGTSALLPMLALGVPGSPTAAVLLGGLLIWGLQPGPLLFVEQKDFVWGLIASMYLGNLVGLIIVLTCVPLFAAILRIPFSIIAPVILVICAIGAYTVHNSAFDVVLMMVFGIVGYAMKKTGYPLAPMVLAIVLGDKAEEAFRQSLLASGGNLGGFFSNGLVATIMVLGLIALFWGVIASAWTRLRGVPTTA
jgi:TctA family transporter